MDEKIIKKNAVPVIAAMITALAFSFISRGQMYNFFGDAQKSVATYQSLLYICKQNKTPDI